MSKLINISMPKGLYKLLDEMSKKEDRSKSGIIRQALKMYWVYKYEGKGITIPLEDVDTYFPKELVEPINNLMKGTK